VLAESDKLQQGLVAASVRMRQAAVGELCGDETRSSLRAAAATGSVRQKMSTVARALGL
jgi:hypothetical protein